MESEDAIAQQGESNETLDVAAGAATELYWRLFHANFGTRFHAFLEWNGVLGEYIRMVRDSGVPPAQINTHTQIAVMVPAYRLEYLASKLHCILGPFLQKATPAARARFIHVLFNGEHHDKA